MKKSTSILTPLKRETIILCKAASLGCWSISGCSQTQPELTFHHTMGGIGGIGIWAHFFPCFCVRQGPVTVEESVQGVLQLLAQLSASSNGTFWDWRGQRLPW